MASPTSTYADVIPIMDAAVNNERGIRFRLPTWGKALNFRQRCFRYRARYREEELIRLGHIPGLIPRSPYDHLQINIEAPSGKDYTMACPKELRSTPFDVVIRAKTPDGQLLDADGNPLEIHEEQQIGDLGLESED